MRPAAWVPALLMAALVVVLAPRSRSEEPEKESGENIEARQRWRLEHRLGPDGKYDPRAPLEAKLQVESGLRAAAPIRIQDAGIWNWEWLGPGNIGGRVRALAIHPTLPNTMWAGTAGGGIWWTTNGGNSWSPLSDFLPCLAVASLVFDPTNPSTLYAGTGELVGSNSSIAGVGIFKSTTGGLTWTHLSATATFDYVSSLAHHPTLSGVALAGTSLGVFRTTNGGATWPILFVPGDAVRYVGYHPANPQIIGVGTSSNFYMSTNGGTTWTRQTSGLPGKMPANPGDCVAAFPANFGKHVYVQAASTGHKGNVLANWIYESRDSGQTWAPILTTNADNWSNALWAAPNDTNLIVFGGFGDLRRSTNGTTSTWISDWTLYNAGLSAHGDQHAVVPHPGYNGTTNRTVFVANDGGVQKVNDILTVTTNSGWTNLANGLGCSQFFTGAVSPDGGIVMGGIQDMGTGMRGPGAGSLEWTMPGGGDGFHCAVDYLNTQRRYHSAQFLDIWRTTNGGASWSPATSGLVDHDSLWCDFAAPYEMSPHHPQTLVAGGASLWRTTNGAASWTPFRGRLSGGPYCTAIAFAASNTNVVYAGYDNGILSVTSDGGLSWHDHLVPGNRRITDIAVNPAVWTEVFVSINGTSNNNLLHTIDAGENWDVRNGSGPTGLPTIAVNTVTFHPLQPNWVYVGTDIGVFASENKGLDWSVTRAGTNSEGPNNVEVDDLVWQGDTHLLAATHGRGMYRCAPLPIVYVDKLYVGPEDGSETRPYNTVAEAVAAYGPGAIVQIKNGTYPEPPLVIDKRGVVRASNGAVRIE